jgi:hypothetical protein
MDAQMIQAVIGANEAEHNREQEQEEENARERQGYKYEPVPTAHHDEELNDTEESDFELELEIERDTFQRQHSNLEAHLRSFRKSNRGRAITMAFGVVGVLLFLYWAVM